MIEIGILKNFDSGTYKAGVQLAGSLTTYFDNVSVAKNIPSSALVIGNYVILAIPGGNPKDACIIAAWPQGSPGGGGSKIQDADGDTSWDVEQSADDDKIHGKVKSVEAFLLDDVGILTLAKQSGAAGWQDTDQTIAHNTETKLNWDTEEYDIQGEFDLTNDRFTAKDAGVYFCMCQVQLKYPVAGKWGLVSIYKNGTRIKFAALFAVDGSDSLVTSIATFVQLSASDYIEFYYKHYMGVSKVTNGAQERTYFGVAKVA
jgi:hypothetical protein